MSLSVPPGSEVPVKEESDVDQNQSDEGDTEASPTKSPSTPKSVKSKTSSGTIPQHGAAGGCPGEERAAGQVKGRHAGTALCFMSDS